MSSKNITTLRQKIVFASLTFSGLFLILFTILPELLGSGKAGFGSIQLLFLKNGAVIFIAGLIPLLFPGIINHVKNIFSDNDYQIERQGDLANHPFFTRYDFILLILFLVAGNLFALHIVGKQNYIYTWDLAIFSDRYAAISAAFKGNPLKAIIMVLGSIQHQHYNFFAPFLLMPFSLLFGVERLPYILSMVNIFLFPSAISFLLLSKRAAYMQYHDRLPLSASVIILFTFFLFTFVWIPLLDGQVGIGGFFIIGLILFTYFKYPFTAQRYRALILIGILVSTLVLFRQYYIFWSLSFFITLIFNEAFFLFTEHRFERKRLLVLSKKVLFTIFISGFFFLMIAAPFLIKILFSGDYSYITIYKFSGSTFQDFKRLLGHFGGLYITLTLLGICVSFYYRNTRKMGSFLLIQWVVTFFLFTRIHSFFPHHYHILIPTMLLFIALFMTVVLINVNSRVLRIVICCAYILISSLTFSAVFSPGVSAYTKHVSIMFPINRYKPPVRNDIPEIKKMLNVIKSLLTNPDDRLYVLAASDFLNSETISKARLSLPDTPDIVRQILRTSDVDLKDGFPNNLFKAKYVLISDPIQHDFGTDQTRIINIPAEAILKGINMGISYKRLPYEFNLDKGVKAYIYERIGFFNQSDVDFLSGELRKYYPNTPFVYQANMSDTYTTGR